MSQASKYLLGIFSALFAAMMFYSEATAPSKAPIVGYLVAILCVAITIACFSKLLRNAAVRLIGAMVFVATVAYLVDELLNEPAKKYTGTTEPHWLNAIFAILTFGLPGLCVALSGIYPKWGKGAEVFRGETSSRTDHEMDNSDLTKTSAECSEE